MYMTRDELADKYDDICDVLYRYNFGLITEHDAVWSIIDIVYTYPYTSKAADDGGDKS